MVNENGLKPPPPPVIVTLAVATGSQFGCGLGDGLGDGEELGPGDALGLGETLGEGLGLVPASVAVAPALRKIRLMAMTTHWIQSGRFIGRGELRAGVA
jgi:hypothetical protein